MLPIPFKFQIREFIQKDPEKASLSLVMVLIYVAFFIDIHLF